MKKLIYIEENFITPDECQQFIDFAVDNKNEIPYGNGDTYSTKVDWKNHTAIYFGGNFDSTVPSLDNVIVNRVVDICKSFDPKANLDYVGVVRWPVGTFMKPHVDDNNVHNPDVFAAMLYLNNNFSGGYTCFEDFEVKPEPGKLIIFSNSQYLHYVSKVEGDERFVLSFWYNSLNK